MKKRTCFALSLLLVLGLALAGCGSKITAEEIVAKMQETVENTQDAHAVLSVALNAQGIEASAVAEVWEKSPNKLRAEVLESSQAKYVGATMVSDGQQAWLYEPASNVVMFGPMDSIETPLPQEMLAELQHVIQQMLDASNVELVGEEAVAGREAYKLTLSPKGDAEPQVFPGNGTATLWVDKEQWFVLKATYEAASFGQGTMEVRSFELNPGLPDDLFTYTPPEGAKVVDVQAQQPVPLTLDEAKVQAGFPLLVPEYVPGNATLIEVFQMGDSIILRYDHSPDVSFALVQGSALSELSPFDMAAAEMTAKTQEFQVQGQVATALTDEAGGNTLLSWTENDVSITIAGHISLDEAIKVAESLK